MQRIKMEYRDMLAARQYLTEIIKENHAFGSLAPHDPEILKEREIKKELIKECTFYIQQLDNCFLDAIQMINFQIALNYPLL